MHHAHRSTGFNVVPVLFLALGSALLYAVASVVQTQEAAHAPKRQSLRPRLLLTLLRRPLWVLGNAGDLGGYGLQFLALRDGSVALVQPLLLSGLIFAIPLGAVVGSGKLRVRDWISAGAVVAGLAAFLALARPGRAQPTASMAAWVTLGAIAVAVVGALVVAATKASDRARAGLLSAAAGVVYGITAALTETTGHVLRHGIVHLFLSWPLYVLVGSGAVGMLLVQSSFQVGLPGASLPLLTVIDPLVGVAVGALVFREHLALHGATTPGAVAALAVMSAGVLVLGSSPIVLGPRVR